jgi:hypothetical protein
MVPGDYIRTLAVCQSGIAQECGESAKNMVNGLNAVSQTYFRTATDLNGFVLNSAKGATSFPKTLLIGGDAVEAVSRALNLRNHD